MSLCSRVAVLVVALAAVGCASHGESRIPTRALQGIEGGRPIALAWYDRTHLLVEATGNGDAFTSSTINVVDTASSDAVTPIRVNAPCERGKDDGQLLVGGGNGQVLLVKSCAAASPDKPFTYFLVVAKVDNNRTIQPTKTLPLTPLNPAGADIVPDDASAGLDVSAPIVFSSGGLCAAAGTVDDSGVHTMHLAAVDTSKAIDVSGLLSETTCSTGTRAFLPTYSPDGKHFALFVQPPDPNVEGPDRFGLPTNLYNSDGRTATKLVTGISYANGLTWLSGDELLYSDNNGVVRCRQGCGRVLAGKYGSVTASADGHTFAVLTETDEGPDGVVIGQL